MKSVYAVLGDVSYTCGVSYLGDFSRYHNGYKKNCDGKFRDLCGTGYIIVGFVDTVICKDAYELLCKNNKLIYQSEVRNNKNSGHMFFFCIFDCK